MTDLTRSKPEANPKQTRSKPEANPKQTYVPGEVKSSYRNRIISPGAPSSKKGLRKYQKTA
jgi:hypothetical protein